jgi:hypothetical protein
MPKPAMALDNIPSKIQIPTYQKYCHGKETGGMYEVFIKNIPLCFE